MQFWIDRRRFLYRNFQGTGESLTSYTKPRRAGSLFRLGIGRKSTTSGRGDEYVQGVIRMNFNGDWKKLKKEIDLVRREYYSHAIGRPNRLMCTLLVLGEDHRFRYHPGFDPIALGRAAWRTYVCGRREGGSTIAMQIARVLMRRNRYTLSRKFREVILAVRLTRYLTRRELPGLYLWVAYYGWRMNNLRQACDRLGINPTSPDLHSAAKLVARLKYPEPQKASTIRHRKINKRCAYLIERFNKAEQRANSNLEWCDETI